MKSFKNYTEALKGNQHKIDKNKNGKVDAHDFKLLRKEEQDLEEAKPGLYANINAKRKRIENGSGEKMRKPGSKGAPSASDFKDAAKTANEEVDLEEAEDPCWDSHKQVGMKMKGGKKVPNCVPKNEEVEMCDECDMPEADCECDHEDDKTEMKEGKHVVGVTISDPNHSAVSQRNEKKMRKAKVSAPDKDTAINNALAYYKKRGYKVHDHNYIGLHTEENIQELSKDTLDSYRQKAFADQPSTRSDNPAKYDKRKAGREKAFDKVLGRKPTTMRKESVVPDHMKGKQKPYVSSDGKGNHEVLGNTGQTKATFTRKEHGTEARNKAIAHLKKNYDAYMKEAVEPPFDGPYTTSKPAKKNSDGTTQSPMSRARELAKQAVPKKMKEDLDEQRINGREYASQGVMHPDHAKMDIHKVSGQHVDFYASKTGDKMQGKVTKNDGKSVHIQAHKELGDGKLHKFKVQRGLPNSQNEQAPVAPTLDKKYIKGTPEHKAYKASKKPINGMPTGKMKEDLDEKMNMAKADMGDVITDFKQSDAPQFAGKSDEKRRQMAIAAKLQADKAQKEERDLKNYKQFVEDIYQNLPQLEEEIDIIEEDAEQLDEYESGKDGVYRHTKKATYGTSYQGDDDEKEKPKAPAGEKRGRGRPAGSSSGARQKGAATKSRSGVEYTGFKLHLPNNNR